jgi:PAS domain S-box-containing protein
MRSIFESAIEGIVVIDERGRIESANTALLNLLGYQAHELIGQNISLLMPSPYREHHNEYLANYLVDRETDHHRQRPRRAGRA